MRNLQIWCADENQLLKFEKLILLEIEDTCQYKVNEEAREYDIHQVSGKVDLQYECGEIIQHNGRNGIYVGKNARLLVFIIMGACGNSLLRACILKWNLKVRN